MMIDHDLTTLQSIVFNELKITYYLKGIFTGNIFCIYVTIYAMQQYAL